MVRVTRRYRFSASHRLHSPQLSGEENRRIYGKCNYPFGHGHNYEIEISVRGPVDPETGLAVNPALLDQLVTERIVRPFDHRDLNTEVPELSEFVPTTENLGRVIRQRLEERWKDTFAGPWPALDTVRIRETDRNIFEVD
ncbi:MAG: 6-carboxytetrahydropterin synthase [Bryobacteraceae bacterium]